MKRENIERRRKKLSEAERWSVRESRLRGIERKMESMEGVSKTDNKKKYKKPRNNNTRTFHAL